MSSVKALSLFLIAAVFALGAVHPAYVSTSHVIVILVDGLSYSDVRHVAIDDSVNRYSAGLMSVGLLSKPDPAANVYASLGAGDSIHVGDVSAGRLCTALHAAGKRAGIVDDGATLYAPLRHLLPTSDDVLVRGSSDNASAAAWTAKAVETLWHDDLVVVHIGSRSEWERALKAVSTSRGNAETPCRLFFVSATPPPAWNQLTPVSVLDFDVTPLWSGPTEKCLLTSTTTRTPGLIAARDLAPSILSYLGVPVPIQMTGAPIEIRNITPVERDRILSHLDRVTNFDQRAQSPFFWALGFVGGIVVFTVLGLFLKGKPVGSPLVLYLLRVLSSWPLALLLVWLFDPRSMAAYLAWIGVLSFAIGLLRSPQFIFFVTAVVIVIDAVFGSRLVSQAVMSAYMMSGIRFYGIGNEYMGVLLGGALMAPIVFQRPLGLAGRPQVRDERLRPPNPQSWGNQTPPDGAGQLPESKRELFAHALLGLFLATVVFVLSFPAYGAKAGGAVTATATFLFLFWELRGEKVTVGRAAFAIAAGFALVFVWATASRMLHLTPTHIDTAVGALGAGRFGYIIGVAHRKIGLAVRVALHPGTVVGAIALIVLCIGARILLRDQLQALWARSPVYRSVIGAGARGAVVALLVNDSGIIAAILLTIALVLPVLYNIFEANFPLGGDAAVRSPSGNRVRGGVADGG